MRVILTGATGFIGSAVADALVQQGHDLIALVRSKSSMLSKKIDQYECDFAHLEKLPPEIFLDVDCFIHCAARAHITRMSSESLFSKYFSDNVVASIELAKLAANYGVTRFIYLSSIGVNGKYSISPFTELSTAFPHDSYSISKFEAEVGLLEIASASSLEMVIIRPPLVYGPGVPGNFSSLIKWISRGVPLPLGSIFNKRSLIALDNLVDFIVLCADLERSPKAANQTFLIADGEDVSTTDLLLKVSRAYGVRACLLPVPVLFLRFFASLFRMSYLSDRLFLNLQIDSTKARKLLGWEPVVTMDQQLRQMVEIDTRRGNK